MHTLLTSLVREEVTAMTETEPTPLQTAIRPLTDEEVAQQRAALASSAALLARMQARHGGKPLAESWPMICAAREERSRQQQ